MEAQDYKKLVKALRCKRDDCEGCDLAFLDNDEGWMCQYAAKDDDAADAIEALQAEVKELRRLNIELFDDLPKLGEWIDKNGAVVPLGKDGYAVDSCYCSICGDWLTASDEYATRGKHCPNCGAKMEVQDESAGSL